MEAVLPIMFAMAMEADLLTIGRGKELATHETIIWSVIFYHFSNGNCCQSSFFFSSLRRSEGGFTIFLDLHAETTPMGIRNMAKKRAPTLVVAVAMALPTAAMSMRQMMWIERSFVRADVHVTRMETRKVANWFYITISPKSMKENAYHPSEEWITAWEALALTFLGHGK